MHLQRGHELSGTAIVWLTRDGGDNDISGFMQCLTKALRRLLQYPGRSAEEQASPTPPFAGG